MREPIAGTIDVGGISLGYWEWPGGAESNEAAPLVFAHATGFHARVFDAIIEHFPKRRVLSLDLRGHGRSEGGPVDSWAEIAGDIAAMMEQLGLAGAVGIGHSMGAHAMLQVAHDHPHAFRQLILFDPTVLAPEFYTQGDALFTADNPHPAIRRKRDFASVEAMMERFEDREPYSLFAPRVFADYCQHGLVSAANGEGMELACSPEVEAGVYASSRSNAAIHQAASKVTIPVLVVRAKQTGVAGDFKSSPTWPDLASTISGATDMYRPDRTHFHPLEDPDDAARIIAEAVQH
ncbi:MAG: alpha/beta hydrolase [Pseudomonadota bacterium]